QQADLARALGCARVVFNDAVALRRDAWAAQEKISDTEVQRRVITEAKRSPDRAWLSEVSSVALVQACQDARRAHRNFLDSVTGRRAGRRIGSPRFRSKRDHRQTLRLTRNGFSVRETAHGVGVVRIAKVGEVRFALSRPLPSEPRSAESRVGTEGRGRR